MITTFYGYLEAAYLLAPYLSDFATGAIATQLDRRIESSALVRSQVESKTSGTKTTYQQLDRRIDTGLKTTYQQLDLRIDAGIETVRSSLNRTVETTTAIYQQLDLRSTNGLGTVQTQIDQRIDAGSASLFQQISLRLVNDFNLLGQLDRFITTGSKTTHQELGRGPVSHQICDGYLTGPYLSDPYLAPTICAHLRTDIDRRLAKSSNVYTQLDRRIDTGLKRTKTQLESRIVKDVAIPTQLLRTSAVLTNSQLLISIYNTTQLRILYEFPSRGTSGTNWTVVAGGTAAGDRGINNVNTDIVEQVYRSTGTSITIQCDTQISQGIFLDTLAILGHNFTTSASVTLQGSNDVGFSSVPFAEALTVETENIYYIAPSLPLSSYRYWRIVAVDVTNPDGYLQIGTIVFGSALIFNGECFVDEVTRRKTHFADRIRTEGYSSVSNDRALKRGLGLRFQKLNYARDNYLNLVEAIDYIRTSLKALWIPTPQYPSRFAVFGKLAEIPVETHKAISQTADYIDLDINVDEAL